MHVKEVGYALRTGRRAGGIEPPSEDTQELAAAHNAPIVRTALSNRFQSKVMRALPKALDLVQNRRLLKRASSFSSSIEAMGRNLLSFTP
jgi:hypothetical protein